MHLFKCLTEEGVFVYAYAYDGVEALKLSNQNMAVLVFTKVDIVVEPMAITPESF